MGNLFSSDEEESPMDPRLRLSGWRIGVVGFANYIYRKSFKFDDIINNTYPKKILRDNRIKWYAYTTNDRKKLSEFGLIHKDSKQTGGQALQSDPSAPKISNPTQAPQEQAAPQEQLQQDAPQRQAPIAEATRQPRVEEQVRQQQEMKKSKLMMTPPNHMTYITLIRETEPENTNQMISYIIPTAYAIEYLPEKILVNVYNNNSPENPLVIPVRWLIRYEPAVNSDFEEIYQGGVLKPKTSENDGVGEKILDTYFKLALRVGKSLEENRPDFTKFTLSDLMMYLGLCITFGTNDLLDYFQVKYLTTVIRAYSNEELRTKLLNRLAILLQEYEYGCKLTILSYTSFVHLATDYRDRGGSVVELVFNNVLKTLSSNNCGAPDAANDRWYGPRLSSYPPPPVARTKRMGRFLDVDILKERFPHDSLIFIWSSKGLNKGGFQNRQIIKLRKLNRIEYKWIRDEDGNILYPYVKRFIHDDEHCGSFNAQVEYPLLSAVLLIPPDKNIYRDSKKSLVRRKKLPPLNRNELVMGNSMLNSKKVSVGFDDDDNRVLIPRAMQMRVTNREEFPPMSKPRIYSRMLKKYVYPEHKLDKQENALMAAQKSRPPGSFFWRFATIGEYLREKSLYLFWFIDTADKDKSQKKISVKTTEDLIRYITDAKQKKWNPINAKGLEGEENIGDALGAIDQPRDIDLQDEDMQQGGYLKINPSDSDFFNKSIYQY